MRGESSTDRHWKRWGATDPYYAVLTSDEYHADKLDSAARQRFFESGKEQVEAAFNIVRSHLDVGFAPERCLDFGCGVGRTLIPLARRSRDAVGADISPAMLAEAKRNCQEKAVDNVAFAESDAGLSRVMGQFDFIFSTIVFHHIRTEQGYPLLKALLGKLRPGGVITLQFLYKLHGSMPLVAARWVQARVPLAHHMVNLVRGRPLGTPRMEGNVYSLDRLFEILEQAGLRTTVSQITRHEVCSYVMLYAQKE